ncbi:FtsW/RodA/SpoVE family cell cycle protein [Actinomycetospora endophytica]|uniref:FtsW/RodA/SpoVE family cell cycle protein n=1 Tax=Actinomycetospora endophytica TaxID=2291215 RepID=A0ABS8PA28_9PSEU|nr:FtsW/RodA/SpoVE family cell cycle protein [Actinomycetospora endophytica]MCD2195120.1 FtsW/RodA/SpoVE family cell cycle protein [Actinomycetospora endophytica]
MSVEIDQQHALSFALGYLGLAYLALFAGAHLAVRRWAPYADPLILPCVALLTGLGLVMIHRLDLAAAASAVGQGLPAPSSNAIRQLAWAGGSVVLLAVVMWRLPDHRVLSRYSYLLGLVGLVLLVLPGVLPASISQVNGAKLWIRVGPVSLQPGEFAKLAIIVFAASLLVEKRELFTTAGRRLGRMEFPRPRDLAPLVIAWLAAVGVLALEKELGASLLFFGVVLAMIYIATERVSWVLIGLAFFAATSVLAYHLFAHVQVRVQVWESPFADFAGNGYQLSQGLFGLAYGGMLGTGLGAGRPDLVPLANTDFIIAGMGEELGLTGLAAILCVYLLLIGRGLHAANAARDGFSTLLAAGLSFSLALQVFIVVGGVTDLIPETGLTAPFLSYGGSSLLANYVLVAILLRISHHVRRPEEARPAAPVTPLAEAATMVSSRAPAE